MHPHLNKNLFLVKEHVGMFKAVNNFDVFDPETGEEILWCREPKLGIFSKLFRFTDYKTMTPFDVEVTTPDGEPVLRVQRGISLFLSSVNVHDENDERVGGFKQKLFTIGGAFRVLGANSSGNGPAGSSSSSTTASNWRKSRRNGPASARNSSRAPTTTSSRSPRTCRPRIRSGS
mgnify:CR=1 FL=1